MKKQPHPRLERFLLAVWFVLGGSATFYLTVDRIRENRELYALVAIAAFLFDGLFFKTFFSLIRQKELPEVFKLAGNALFVLLRAVGKLSERISDTVHRSEKHLVDGKHERSFVFETHEKNERIRRRKLPKLPKNADEKAKIRHAYTAFVFEKDRDIPSHLTPHEVEARIDPKHDRKELFSAYDAARYSE